MSAIGDFAEGGAFFITLARCPADGFVFVAFVIFFFLTFDESGVVDAIFIFEEVAGFAIMRNLDGIDATAGDAGHWTFCEAVPRVEAEVTIAQVVAGVCQLGYGATEGDAGIGFSAFHGAWIIAAGDFDIGDAIDIGDSADFAEFFATLGVIFIDGIEIALVVALNRNIAAVAERRAIIRIRLITFIADVEFFSACVGAAGHRDGIIIGDFAEFLSAVDDRNLVIDALDGLILIIAEGDEIIRAGGIIDNLASRIGGDAFC